MVPAKPKLVETFDPHALDRALAGTIFARKLHYFPETGSTNSLAMEAAAQDAPEGSAFIADYQIAGRGRGDHNWHSESGDSLLFSIVLRPRIAAADTLWLSLMAGVAVQHAIHDQLALNGDLRWPNDLLVNGKKFCGILTELATDLDRVRFAVIGIGVNVNQRAFPKELGDIATSLRIETGRKHARFELLVALLKSLHVEYKTLLENLSRAQRPVLLKRITGISSYVSGKEVHVSESGGYDGTTAGLDERGFLLVRTPAGIRKVISGGVREN